MNESVKKNVGSQRPHHYGRIRYFISYYNSATDASPDYRVRKLIVDSSVTEPKHLNDIAVRKAKEHGWVWTSFLIYGPNGQIVSKRVARKLKKSI